MAESARAERLDQALNELKMTCPEVEAASVVTYDGLPMAAALPPGMDEERVAAMCAALLSLGERASEGLGRGELLQVSIEGENGRVHLLSADDEAVLVAVSSKTAKSGLVLFELKRTALRVAEILQPDPSTAVEPPAPIDAAPEADPVVPADTEPPVLPAQTTGGGLLADAPGEFTRAAERIVNQSPMRWAHTEFDSLQITPAPGWS